MCVYQRPSRPSVERLTTWLSHPPPTGELLEKARADFVSGRGDEAETMATMKKWHAEHSYLLCPHTAVGVHAADSLGMLEAGRTVCLATAHPAKFPEATDQLGIESPLPEELAKLANLPMRSVLLPNSEAEVKKYMLGRIPSMDD